MRFGHALYRYLREILLADPALGSLYLIKVNISGGFYQISLDINGIPELGVVLPTEKGQNILVVLPLVLPMGWKIARPFSTQ